MQRPVSLIWRSCLQACFGIIVSPMFIVLASLVIVKIVVNVVRIIFKARRLGYVRHSQLGNVSRQFNAVFDVAVVSTVEELDFLINRSPCYVKRMFQVMMTCCAKYWYGDYQMKLWPESHFIEFFTKTGACQHLVHDGEYYSLRADELDDFVFFNGNFIDFRAIRFNLDQVVSITLNTKEIIKSTASKADWRLAMLHAQVFVAFYLPALGHNWVHFVLPSSMAVAINRVLPDTSVLKQLLDPHFRFTNRINHQALFAPIASNNKNGFIGRYLAPWSSFPMTKDVFIESVAKKCHEHYNTVPPEQVCPAPILLKEHLKQLP